jgi:hypothetical protein
MRKVNRLTGRLVALVSALPLLVAGLVLAGSPVVAVAQTSVTVTANCGNPSHGSVTFTGGTSSETAFVYLGTDASQNSPASLEIGPVSLGSTVTSGLIADGGYNYLIKVSGVTEKTGSFTIGPCTEIVWGTTSTTAPATVHDTTASGGGTVSYTFYRNGTCTGTGAPAGSGTSSNPEGPLGGGSYSFTATFVPTGSVIGAVSACEPFTVTPPPGPTATSITTVVFNAATKAALIGGNLVAGGSVYDTSTVTAGATGTVSYKFWTNGDCGVSEVVAGTDAGTAFALGSQSGTEGPLTAGSYSFEAVYTSDNTALFTNATASCEPFSVTAPPTGPAPTTTSTAVFDAATKAALIDGNLTAGGSAYDTSTVTTGATGTVSYLFWTNGDCGVSEVVAGTDAGTALALGSHSSAVGPLTAGSYSFEAVYTSHNTALFAGSTSACEPFTVVAGGVGGSTASPSPTATPTGGVLAATGGNTPAQGLALFLIAFGLLAMVGGALAWRRRRI